MSHRKPANDPIPFKACNNKAIERKQILTQEQEIVHTCNGDLNHVEETCVCFCGYHWKRNEPKDSIGE